MAAKTYYKYEYHGSIKVQGRLIETDYRRVIFAENAESAIAFIRENYMNRYGLPIDGPYDVCIFNRRSIKKISTEKFKEEDFEKYPKILKGIKTNPQELHAIE